VDLEVGINLRLVDDFLRFQTSICVFNSEVCSESYEFSWIAVISRRKALERNAEVLERTATVSFCPRECRVHFAALEQNCKALERFAKALERT
jgi:hypothetical protein